MHAILTAHVRAIATSLPAVGAWYPFAEGATLGHSGPENGAIVLDEEHPRGARIMLEKEVARARFAITCAVYGWMCHARHFATESEARAAYAVMKRSLGTLLDRVRRMECRADEDLLRRLRKFVDDFP
jgi:hypothetical protein